MQQSYLTTLLGLSLACSVQAQTLPAIPGGDFDRWTLDVPGGPMSWTRSDQVYDFMGLPMLNTVSPGTPRSGSAAAVLQAKLHSGQLFAPYLVLGGYQPNNASARPGMASTARPAALHFWYKYTGSVADSTEARVVLTQASGAAQQVIGEGKLKFTPNATTGQYQLGQVIINYTSAAQPDWLRIQFRGNARSAAGTFYLDDVALSNTVLSSREAVLRGPLTISPNPSTSGKFSLHAELDADVTTAAYTVTDITGRVVMRVDAGPASNGIRLIDISRCAPGLYTLNLHTARGPVVRRLLVE